MHANQANNTVDYLALIGIERWLERSRLDIKLEAEIQAKTTTNKSRDLKQNSLVISEFLTDQRCWSLLDAILDSINWHRAEVNIINSESSWHDLSGRVLTFGLKSKCEQKNVVHLPGLPEILSSPKLKLEVMNQLIQAGLLKTDEEK